MNFNRNEHSRFVRWLDRTAEKNPLLWLPCILLLVIAIGVERVSDTAKAAFSRREKPCTTDGRVTIQIERKPFALRVLALSLALIFGFMAVPELSGIIGIDVYADDSDDVTLGYSENDSIDEIPLLSDNVVESGICGDNLTWVLTDNGTLTVSGYGNMYDYLKRHYPSPFYSYNNKIKNVILNEGVTSIGNYAFYNCKLLEAIIMPEGLDTIGISAFANCKSLETIIMPESLVTIGATAFLSCTGIKSISVPMGTVSIGESAFKNCSNLESVVLPDGITNIGYSGSWASFWSSTSYGVFANCINLKNINIPESVTYISPYAFYGCESIEKITLPNTIKSIGHAAFSNCSNLKSVNLPDSLIRIEAYAFCRTSISSIEIPSGVVSMGACVFLNCQKLRDITVDDNNMTYFDIDGVMFMHYGNGSSSIEVFPQNKNMEFYTIPNGITSIGYHSNSLIHYYTSYGSFSNCQTLKEVFIPDTVTTIGEYAFSNCTNLAQIAVPNSVTYIGESAFWNCTNLKKIAIPSSVTEIYNSSFNNCANLTIYCETNSYAETYANENNIPFKDISEFDENTDTDNPNYDNIISSENGTLIYEALSVDGYRPVTQYSIDSITIKFGNGAIYDESNLIFTADDNMIEINKCKYTDSYVTVYYTIWGMGKTNIAITANNGENLTIPISIYDSNLKLEVEAETKDADNLKISGKKEIKNDPFQVGFSITPQLKRSVPSIDINDRELFAEINTLYEQIESKVKSLLNIEKIAITLPNGFIFEDGSIVDNAIPIIPFRLDERTMYFTDNKVLTKVAPIADTGIWKEEYVFNVYIKINGNEYSCNDKIYVKNADYISPPPEDNPTIDDEHRDFYLQNDEYSKKLYNSIRAMINEGNFVETYSDSTLKNCVTDSNTYHDMITMLGIWKTAATSEFTIASDLGSYRNSVNNYCLEFYNVSVKDPNNKRKSAKNATVRFQLVDDLADYSSLLQLVQQDLKDIKFDATFNHINYQIEWSDKSYGINGIYNGIYQVSAGADINSYYEGVKQYLSTKYDNEIKGLLKNCFYGIVGNSASPLNFMSEAVEFCKLYEQANKKIGSMKKLIRTNVSFGMVCGAFKEYKVFCPVDVYVYDYDTDILLGSIVNNKVDGNNRIKMYIDGETKCFELPTIKKYKVKLIGNDIGNMTYSVNEYDKGQVYVKTANYYNLDLQNGKEYTYITDARTEEYLTEQNGNVIYPNEIYATDEQHTHRYNTEWKVDSISHWHECTVCGEHSDTARHIEDNGTITVQPTATTSGTRTYSCTVCGYVMRTETIPENPPEHIHTFGADWKSDSTSHWHECACGEKSDYAGHISNNGVITVQPTEYASGVRTYSCTVCGYIIGTETILPTNEHNPPYIPPYTTPTYINPEISIVTTPTSDEENYPVLEDGFVNDDITVSLKCRLSNLSGKKAHFETKKSFFSDSAVVKATNTDSAKNAASRVIDTIYGGSEHNIVYPFDISVYNAETDEKMQLRSGGYITFEIPVPNSMTDNAEDISVYHISGDTAELLESSLVISDDVTKIRFKATDFSPYMFTMYSETLVENISSGAGVTANSVPVDTAVPVTNGVGIPTAKLPRIMGTTGKKRKYRILRKRRLDDLIFVY